MNKRPQTILFGNGINRLTPGCPSWSDLLAGIDNKTRRCHDFDRIPFTFQYEVLLPDDYYTTRIITPAGNSSHYEVPGNAETEVKRRICDALGAMNSNPFYERLAGLNAQHFITTNYEYLLHQTFENQGYDIDFDNRETRYSLRRRATVANALGMKCSIWSIHGETNKPNTMMLGLDHYCESIGKIDSYIKDSYENHGKRRSDTLERRLLNDGLDDERSWIDLLFCTDVHIIGHGLDYSETDLWWLLNRRMRLFKKLGDAVRPNTITYYGQLDPDKAHLLQKFGVRYHEVPVIDNDYVAQYCRIFDMLEKTMQDR